MLLDFIHILVCGSIFHCKAELYVYATFSSFVIEYPDGYCWGCSKHGMQTSGRLDANSEVGLLSYVFVCSWHFLWLPANSQIDTYY